MSMTWPVVDLKYTCHVHLEKHKETSICPSVIQSVAAAGRPWVLESTGIWFVGFGKYWLNKGRLCIWTFHSVSAYSCIIVVFSLDYLLKVAHTRLPSVGFRSWSRFLAVSLQVTWIISPTVGCHYFPPGLQLPPQPLRGLLPILLLGEQRHNGREQFT